MTIRTDNDHPVGRMCTEEPSLCGSAEIAEIARKLAHDLRQPVAAIRAIAAAAAADVDAGETVLRRLSQISDQASWIRAAIVEISDTGPRFGRLGREHGIGLQVTRSVLAEAGGWLQTERPPGGPTLVRLNLPVAGVWQQAAGAECA
jgi:C4-dicarboxylate-specific signal transduction histidine kinase